MDFLSIIGTIASVGSIPLSFYLYIKSKENSIDKVKRDIVKILSFQIGDRRQLTTFEIQTVINSKSRESKLNTEKITVNHVIEDIVSETISNPLLDKSIKESIITELKNIYFKSELLTSIDKIEFDTRSEIETKTNDVNIEREIKNIIEKRNKLDEITANRERQVFRSSESFAFIAIIMTALATVLTFIGKEKYDNFSKPLNELVQKNDFYFVIGLSIVTGILALIILSFSKIVSKKKNNR